GHVTATLESLNGKITTIQGDVATIKTNAGTANQQLTSPQSSGGLLAMSSASVAASLSAVAAIFALAAWRAARRPKPSAKRLEAQDARRPSRSTGSAPSLSFRFGRNHLPRGSRREPRNAPALQQRPDPDAPDLERRRADRRVCDRIRGRDLAWKGISIEDCGHRSRGGQRSSRRSGRDLLRDPSPVVRRLRSRLSSVRSTGIPRRLD